MPDPAPNDSWAQTGGNAAKSAGHPALGLALANAWTAKIAGSTSRARLAAGPVVADGRVYVADIEGVVRAFGVRDGSVQWTVRTASENDADKNKAVLFGGGAAFDGGRVYATNGIGDAVAIDAASGKLLWKVRPGGPLRGAPTIANGNVYVMSQDNQIFALKQDNGETIWNEAATLETAGVFGVGSPAAAQGTVIAGFSSGN